MLETRTYIHILKNIITRIGQINRMCRKRRYRIQYTQVNAYDYDIYFVF